MKTNIHKKLTWLSRGKTSDPESNGTLSQKAVSPNQFIPQSGEILLSTPLRQQLIKIIWQRTALSRDLFIELYQTPITRFAELAQHIPASEYHHHSHAGGLLDHTLEVMAFAAKLRQQHLLPTGVAPEDQAREAEAWTAGIIYAALLHDVGKIVTDIDIITNDNQVWHPWQDTLNQAYCLKYRKKRDHQLHLVAGSLLATRILPTTAFDWLAQFRELYESFLYCISGHYDQAGVLGEIVIEADKASVAQFMGGNTSTVLKHSLTSLPTQIQTAIKVLVQTQFTLNNPRSGSDGWLTDDTLWLISKTTADKIRAWLLQQGITGVPDSNSRLFDEMQSYGLIIPTPEAKAVWTCNITADSGWSPGRPLTLLRLSPGKIWSISEERPSPFAGHITPSDNTTAVSETSSRTEDKSSTSPENTSTPQNEMVDLALSLFAADEGKISDNNLNSASEQPAVTEPVISTPSHNQAEHVVDITTPPLPGQDFITWLKSGIQNHQIAVNDTMAKVHLVNGQLFLVSPEIFKLYIKMTTGSTGQEWKEVQKNFQKLKLHLRGQDGVNIFSCEVKGPRKIRIVKGYLLPDPKIAFDNSVPENNPYLSLKQTT